MTDKEALQLLRLLQQYVTAYSPDIPQTISALADDLIGSMDGYSVEALQLCAEIIDTEGVT